MGWTWAGSGAGSRTQVGWGGGAGAMLKVNLGPEWAKSELRCAGWDGGGAREMLKVNLGPERSRLGAPGTEAGQGGGWGGEA